ncbi:MAG: Mut7-C RNAse domain-containing protein [Candidatus Caldarchaeum sp.]
MTWLRLLGYDTLYGDNLSDDELIEAARRGERVLVTRDRELAQRAVKGLVRSVLLDSNDVVQGLKKIQSETGITLVFSMDNSRCPECNTVLEKLSNQPPRWVCVFCGKQYWVGGHWRNISKTLERLQT